MTVGVGFLGRAVDFTIGGATLAGIVSKTFSINNTSVDTSDDQSNGKAVYLAEPGRQDATIGLSLKVKNLDLVQSILQNTSQIYATVLTFPDGTTTNSTMTGDAFLNSINFTGEHEALSTLDVELSYSGEIIFVAAT